MIKTRARQNHYYISPGAVGSVGDVLGQVRYKHSAPELEIRWDPEFAGKKENRVGSNVGDGQHKSYTSLGGGARVYDSNWESGRHFRVQEGWIVQNLRPEDSLVEPYVGSTGDYSWRNKLATVYEARRTGDQFLPLPGPYIQSPGEINRGGLGVRVTDIEPGDLSPRIFESVVREQNEKLAPYVAGGRMRR